MFTLSSSSSSRVDLYDRYFGSTSNAFLLCNKVNQSSYLVYCQSWYHQQCYYYCYNMYNKQVVFTTFNTVTCITYINFTAMFTTKNKYLYYV